MKIPFPAFRVQTWSKSAAAVYAVTVLEFDEVSETALVREMIGSAGREFRVSFRELATTAERLAERLNPLLFNLDLGRVTVNKCVPGSRGVETTKKAQPVRPSDALQTHCGRDNRPRAKD